MEKHEIQIGSVTYEVQRVFAGTKTVAQLITERVIKAAEKPSFDGKVEYEVK